MSKLITLALGMLLVPIASTQAEDLLTVYQQAQEADPQLKSSELKVEISAAQKGQALGEMLPQVNATGNWSANQQRIDRGVAAINSNFSGTRYVVSMNQTLIDFAKFWNWRRAAKIEDQYATETIEAQHELMFKVVDRYFSVLEAEDQLYFIQTEKESTQKQQEQVSKQFAKQMLKITDVYEVEARLDQIAADEILADSKRVTAQEGLRELTGSTPQALSKLREGIDYQELEGDLQEWIEVAKSQNPALSAHVSAIEAAENNVAVQKSKYLPVVDLQLNFYDTNTGYQNLNLGGSSQQTQVAAINVNMPIFSGGVTTHQMFEAQHRLQLSKNEQESALRALVKETSDSFLSSNASARHIKASQKALESASKSREAMDRGFQYGVVTISDVLKAQQSEFLAKRDLSQAKYSYIKNRIRFMRAIGLIAEENLQEVNEWLEKS
jgi:outer membrane protein